jgi:Glycosyl hydrolases family 25
MTYPEGVDLSKYDPDDYPWPEFVIVRLGSVVMDDWRLQQHVAYARQNGIMNLGTYYFLYVDGAPEAQADHAYALQQDVGLELAPHFADAESKCDVDTAQRYIARMRELRGDCGLYSGYWIKSHGGGTLGADYGWLPQYQSTYTLPSGWSAEFTKLWQYTSNNGTLDQDRFLGTETEMYDFFGGNMAALDEMLDGMIAAESASALATVDPGPPPDGQTQYYKRGWSRVRFNVNKIKLAEDARVAATEAANAAQDVRLNTNEADDAVLQAELGDHETRIATLEAKPDPVGHTHTDVAVAGPAV